MICTIPEISWHNRDPVLSVDIQPNILNNDLYRLASGGMDFHVLIWYMSINENGSVNLDLAADLTRHQKAVNCVKWSPNGEFLASGDDESVIMIWKRKTENEPLNIVDTANDQDKEIWIENKILRGHMKDIYDLCWSPNSQYLISGSVDNTAMIWDVQKGKSLCILSDHKGFVQGVAWDPLNQYVATLSTDRYLRIFDVQTKKIINRHNKCTLPVPEGHELNGKMIRIYHDDTLHTFFRRLNFSPDGKLLIVPAGVTDYDGCVKPVHTTYIYSRYSLKQPSIILPSPDQYTVAVKCCPVLFELRTYSEFNKPIIPLPYRIIFAVATKSSVYLYDTQQKMPFGLISNIHYNRLTDLTWSQDGKILVVSSADGFCSLITFSADELGKKYKKDETVIESKQISKSDTNNSNKKMEENKENEVNGEELIESDIEMKNICDDEKNNPNEDRIVLTENPKTPNTVNENEVKLSNGSLVIDKNIISSAEKFETPEKKDHPATPISIRRHPRIATTPSTSNSINFKINFETEEKIIEITPTKQSEQKQKSSTKKATPIAVRRKPRVIITNPAESAVIVEEAVDSWPNNIVTATKVEEQNTETKNEIKNKDENLEIKENTEADGLKEIIAENTEDIRLVLEETQEENEKME